MNILFLILLLALGFLLLLKGADFLVEGASIAAKRLKISELVIGLTIVSFGTSAPELVVNVISALQKSNGLVFGNVIGSNFFNTLAVLGLAGLIAPLTVGQSTIWKELPFAFMVTLILYIIVNDNLFADGDKSILSRGDGLVLLAFFIIFLVYVYGMSKNKNFAEESMPHENKETNSFMPVWKMALYIVGGLAGLMFGGDLVVSSAVKIAHKFNVSDKLIGLTIVAAGTSLPELAASAVASFRGKSDIAIGNVIGSNIFNVLLILGVSSVIQPTVYDISLNFDLLLLIAFSMILFIFMRIGKANVLERWQAGFFMLSFITYMAYIIYRG